ncbi:Type I secretion outer membrane protein, TolC [Novosphingobium nitrogenifigens DSM 19370]|uniref:Type I secretion outer membrane protein, TolC n=1 Tax=Novosphingobium nitrogenifigens DSM 19370 TaxID=983920 RepID=F1ZBE8_9SPHN|nr:TolC family protein [Novosphingobium nitrogenifigens]EGD58154.1 Type I secretion outer membrane protein, TolC [Novosphingobium nitrogenifigens DSM 19370]
MIPTPAHRQPRNRKAALCLGLALVALMQSSGVQAQTSTTGHAPALVGPPDDQADNQSNMVRREIVQSDAEDGRASIEVELPPETPRDIRDAALSGQAVGDFHTAMGLAYWTSPALLAQRSLVKSYDYRVPEARAAYGLQLDYQLMMGFQRDHLDPTALQRQLGQTTPTTSWGWSNSAMAILTMPLFTFGRNFASERSALAQRAYQKQVLRSTEQQALYDAISSYAGLIRDRAEVAIARDNLVALEQELLDNETRLKSHEITVTDLEQVKTRVELGRAQLYAAQRDAATSESTFVQKVGVGAATDLADPPLLDLPIRTLEEAYAYAEEHSPVILAAHERERVSRAAVAAAKADLLPRVDLKAQALYGSQSPYNNYARYNEELAQVVVTGPLFESGVRRTKIADAVAANDSDWRLIDGAMRDTRASVAAAWNDWKAQLAAIDHYSAAAVAAKKAYEGAVVQEREGLYTTFDVLQLALELLNTRSTYNSAKATAYIDAAKIMALIGGMEPDFVLPGQDRYNDERHLDRVRHRDDLPLLTPLLRTLDGVTTKSNDRRAVRDPAERIQVPAVKITDPPPPTTPGTLPQTH